MKLIYLEWEDAIGTTNWHSEKELKEYVEKDNAVICQIGWIFSETKKHITLISKISLDTYRDKGTIRSFGSIGKIPKTWIRKRINLTKYVKQNERKKPVAKSAKT